ncbi:MAG TPA: DUF3089 domain-containing protein [Steroidobacteraceae bacterium]|jgi:hypothetical protein|nr:DUF3089 domain-containing protein [Steroidobacteraceae bacterium]
MRLPAFTLAALLLGSATVSAQSSPVAKNDYSDPASWLCRPGRSDDACGQANQDATVVRADGSTQIERFHADPNAPIDCFYVYPTVSLASGGNAAMQVTRQERAVVSQQFARFASVCRPYAPLYRQATLTALRSSLKGHPVSIDRALPYNDVKDAWEHYLAHDNQGRGVALIGHSQGSLVLAQLVSKEIDGKPIQSRILAVILAGYRLQVPVGKDVGGDFKSIPLCHSAAQLGCAINFASFRANRPPPADAKLFGASAGPGLQAACVNPAALGGGSGPLHAYLASGIEPPVVDSAPPGPWTHPPKPISTPFVEVPGLLSAECRNTGTHNYLAVTIHASPGGARSDDITGDVVIDGRVREDWGLHVVDMNLAMGNLIDIVRQQGRAFLAKKSR